MSKAKFVVARELIKEENYEAARALLVTIDHPLAADWLAKLDRLAPAQAAGELGDVVDADGSNSWTTCPVSMISPRSSRKPQNRPHCDRQRRSPRRSNQIMPSRRPTPRLRRLRRIRFRHRPITRPFVDPA